MKMYGNVGARGCVRAWVQQVQRWRCRLRYASLCWPPGGTATSWKSDPQPHLGGSDTLPLTQPAAEIKDVCLGQIK